MVDVGPVVLPGSSLLLGHSDTPQRLHDEAFEVFLGHLALAVVEKLLLDVTFNDRPETLDGVDLGTIGGAGKAALSSAPQRDCALGSFCGLTGCPALGRPYCAW